MHTPASEEQNLRRLVNGYVRESLEAAEQRNTVGKIEPSAVRGLSQITTQGVEYYALRAPPTGAGGAFLTGGAVLDDIEQRKRKMKTKLLKKLRDKDVTDEA